MTINSNKVIQVNLHMYPDQTAFRSTSKYWQMERIGDGNNKTPSYATMGERCIRDLQLRHSTRWESIAYGHTPSTPQLPVTQQHRHGRWRYDYHGVVIGWCGMWKRTGVGTMVCVCDKCGVSNIIVNDSCILLYIQPLTLTFYF